MPKTTLKKILPEGYYTRDKANPFLVRLRQGPYKGLYIQILEDIKIREESLTTTPQLLYNYRILHYGSLNPQECETSKSLSRIIAAIAVEFLSEEIEGGGTLESVECRNPGLKSSS
jgi:hypothetical protein